MDKKESSLDIHAILTRYRSTIEGAFIKKVYHAPPKTFILQLYRSDHGRIDLFIQIDRGIYVGEKREEIQPTQMAMNLRKLLVDQKIRSVRQINFDRVLEICTYQEISLIAEFFREGNLIVCSDGKIEMAVHQREWKNRKIVKGEKYVPPTDFDPVAASDDNIAEIFRNSTGTIVQTLASRLNLGGDIAEEVCLRAGVDKRKMAKESVEEISGLRNALNEIISEAENGKGYVYHESGTISPVRMSHLNEPFEEVEDFAAEVSKRMSEAEETQEDISLKRRMESQQKTIEEYLKKAESMAQAGSIILQHLKTVEEMLNTARRIDRGMDSTGISQNFKLDRGRKILDAEIAGTQITLDIRKSAGENANFYFSESKDYRKKAENARIALENSIRSSISEEKKKRSRKRRFWFEKYRWTFTISGHIIVSGRDRKTNEMVVKKHLESNDIYVHADLYGAPSTVIKASNGTRADDLSIREACIFAISNSRAWTAGIASGSAYWVFPEQVSKSPESGEYVSTGSWIIRGKRNYLFNLPLELYIGMINYEGDELPMVSASADNPMFTGKPLKIVPSKDPRAKAVKKIASSLGLNPEEVDPLLPPGGSLIVGD
ncbi:MAG: NFACT family protein [Candidatus Thermoplasmatota archaeon]|nr:NFACT family protein [Candidatus Thermoplasmatota archaeon]MCL5731405.1 NFACT family protein [Candidatus Thermoplasmatota archaeon]